MDVAVQETVLEVAQFKTAEPLLSSADKDKVRAADFSRHLIHEFFFQQLSSKDFEFLEDALDTLGKGKKRMLVEKEELQDLKDEMADYREVLFLRFCKTNH